MLFRSTKSATSLLINKALQRSLSSPGSDFGEKRSLIGTQPVLNQQKIVLPEYARDTVFHDLFLKRTSQ